ncbi:hypothetical protein HCTETULN_194 [Candidatus Hodgkinia cicadicola]|nr:hypothetical protein HCTETULN_194 [Candidatus Hodgkinia cicadicola]
MRLLTASSKPAEVLVLGPFVSDVIANYSEYSMLAILVVVISSFWRVIVSVD